METHKFTRHDATRIAAETGLSIETVRRALLGLPNTRTSTRKAVEAAAVKLCLVHLMPREETRAA